MDFFTAVCYDGKNVKGKEGIGMEKYTIGVDYGTLSGRALLVEVSTGRELASAVYAYPHAVMDTQLPCGKKLEHDWALQHPQDYLDVLSADERYLECELERITLTVAYCQLHTQLYRALGGGQF